jgi:hypothetical protein
MLRENSTKKPQKSDIFHAFQNSSLFLRDPPQPSVMGGGVGLAPAFQEAKRGMGTAMCSGFPFSERVKKTHRSNKKYTKKEY